jgi:hypothetical protein
MSNWARRFWAKVTAGPVHPVLGTRCWLWKAGTNVRGYGKFKVDGKTRYAHQVAWYLKHNRWTKMHLLHQCDTPGCVRPEHLREGTNLENVRDKMSKGRWRGSSLCGEKHPSSKLKDKAVRRIRELHGQGLTQASLARRFRKVGKSQIQRIVSGENRKAA